jgi:hypothetical protein
MADPGSDGIAKWSELRSSLRAVLPVIDSRIAMGLEVFPALGTTSSDSCGPTPLINVDIGIGHASMVENVINTTGPHGHTPTYAALEAAASYFQSIPDSNGSHYIVLATDGAPNCNASLDASTCTCSSVNGGCPSIGCLDDTRTIAKIAELAAAGVHTFVIGLPGAEQFANVLDQMAIAGGRPQAGSPRYFNPTSQDTLTATLASITSGLIDCRFQLDMAAPDPNMVDVRLNGSSLRRDTTHQDGWDWTDMNYDNITFYGATCTEVEDPAGGQTLIAAFGCPPPG